MNQIYLVRHGQTTGQARNYRSMGQLLIDFDRPDFGDEPLTDHGRDQVMTLARKIKETLKPDGHYLLFTSDTRRCSDTGGILAEELGIWAGGGDSCWFVNREISPGVGATDAELSAIVNMYEKHPYTKYADRVTFHGALLVTHHTIIPPLAAFISRKKKFQEVVQVGEIQTAQAVYLDLESRTHRILL